jgi:hypothetical protein
MNSNPELLNNKNTYKMKYQFCVKEQFGTAWTRAWPSPKQIPGCDPRFYGSSPSGQGIGKVPKYLYTD